MLKNAFEKLISLKAAPQKYANAGLKINLDGKKRSAFSVLGYKESSWDLINQLARAWIIETGFCNQETNKNKCILW